MPGTQVEQIQLDMSRVYDDTLSPLNAESSAVNIEDDLNFVRSQIKLMLGTDNTNWYDTPTSTLTLLKARQSLETKFMIRRRQVLTDVSVPAGQNYVVLSQASGQTPTRPLAIAPTTEGVLVAQLAGAVGSHSLAEVAGINAISPKNLCHVVDGSTGDVILSGGKSILALIQTGSGATDGGTIDDSSNAVQLSFVRVNSTNDDLEAVPFADIAGKSINYTYADRVNMAAAIEQDFDLAGIIADQTASVDVTLQNAVTNQSGNVTQGAKSIAILLSDTYAWAFKESGGADILSANAAAAGDFVNVGSGANPASFKGFGTGEFVDSLAVDTGGQTINVGATAGQIDSVTLKMAATTGAVTLQGATEINFIDSRQTTALPLTDALNPSLDGAPVSIYDAINQARAMGGATTRADAHTTGKVSANTLIVGPGGAGTQNLSAALLDYTGKSFVTDVLIWINGVYQRPGADAAANNDVYPATVAADIAVGGFYCEKTVKSAANIMMMLIA